MGSSASLIGGNSSLLLLDIVRVDVGLWSIVKEREREGSFAFVRLFPVTKNQLFRVLPISSFDYNGFGHDSRVSVLW